MPHERRLSGGLLAVACDADGAEITVPLEGDELVVRVDDSLTVTAAQRA